MFDIEARPLHTTFTTGAGLRYAWCRDADASLYITARIEWLWVIIDMVDTFDTLQRITILFILYYIIEAKWGNNFWLVEASFDEDDVSSGFQNASSRLNTSLYKDTDSIARAKADMLLVSILIRFGDTLQMVSAMLKDDSFDRIRCLFSNSQEICFIIKQKHINGMEICVSHWRPHSLEDTTMARFVSRACRIRRAHRGL